MNDSTTLHKIIKNIMLNWIVKMDIADTRDELNHVSLLVTYFMGPLIASITGFLRVRRIYRDSVVLSIMYNVYYINIYIYSLISLTEQISV